MYEQQSNQAEGDNMYKLMSLIAILILISTNASCGVENYKRMNNVVIETEITNESGEKEIQTRILGYIQRDSDLALIPMNEGNADYLQYLEDVKNGAEVTDFDYEAEEARQIAASIVAKVATDREELIQSKIREIAIKELVTEGKIEVIAEEPVAAALSYEILEIGE